ncbi:MAG: ABC transporter ATP-binding protein [Lachnospiraceae bacterium]
MDIVTMEHVTKVYGEGDNRVWGLHDVSMTVSQGETLAIVGASGSGKSTLLHIMGGVDAPTSGTVIVDGKDITKLNDDQMSVFRRRKIGFVFQAYHLIPVLSVEENITMPILLDHRKPDKEYIEHIMDMLGIWDRRKHLPNQLSGGQQQRAAIARALANHPSLILADEPTGALDSKNGNEVISLLQKSVKELNQTLVLITHNIDLAREADRMIKLADGEIVS